MQSWALDFSNESQPKGGDYDRLRWDFFELKWVGSLVCYSSEYFLADNCCCTSLQAPSGMIQTQHSGDPEVSERPSSSFQQVTTHLLWISSSLIRLTQVLCIHKCIFTFFKQTNVKCCRINIAIISFSILSCVRKLPLAFDGTNYPSKHKKILIFTKFNVFIYFKHIYCPCKLLFITLHGLTSKEVDPCPLLWRF